MFLVFNNIQRNKEIARNEQEKQTALKERAREKRTEEARANAERIAKEDPGFAIPVEPARSRYTLGSMDPKDKYPFAVTLDNLGATIERIELVQQTVPGRFDYRSLRTKQREGYLGYLALEESKSSLIIHSVPIGSAASKAVCKERPELVGLLPGDKIVGWDSLSGFPSQYKLDKRLSNQPAGRQIELTIQRDTLAEAAKSEDDKSDQNATPKNTLTFTCVFTERPLDVLRAEDDFAAEQVEGNDPNGSCATTLAMVDKVSIEEGERSIAGLERTLKGTWSAKALEIEGGMGVEFTLPLREYLTLAGVKANLELVKQFRLYQLKSNEPKSKARDHHLELTTIVRNLDDEAHSVALRQEGLNGVSLEGWWYPTKISPYFFSAAGARDIIVSNAFASHALITTRTAVSNAITYPNDPDLLLF
jgi:YidC/Oxa1 family membrane protein insertase